MNAPMKEPTAGGLVEEPRPRVPLWLLASLTFSATLAMHIFVPALPQVAQDLSASVGAMQLTISLYILGLAVGQLIYGPIADRFGRRPTLIAGLSLYIMAGIAAAMAPSAHALIAARLFQAMGGCVGMVLSRAIIRDTSSPQDSVRSLALVNLFITAGPAVAPLIGSAVMSTAGWRFIFVLLALFGVMNIMFTVWLLPETRRAGGDNSVTTLARNYRSLLTSPAFLGYAIGGGCATTSMYAFIGAAPFIFINELGRSAYEVGIYLAILVTGIWIGSIVVSRLIMRVPIRSLLIGGNLVSLVAALVFLGVVASGHLTVSWVVGLMFLFLFGAGFAAPTALTQAVSVNPKVVGSASGLYGFAQMSVGALCAGLAGVGSHPALAAALVLGGATIVAQIAFMIAQRNAPKLR
ncbi:MULTISPECIES: multidrug effflux MFS transporter [unclassified Chelatococcus]|uniref:multidrug effflux MFS transporter n=1 Tax=unclassified Chelatococcus TaxID=2638111 RepID=UPI00224BC3FF|nr:multidrug effflux MFS transporter [Chelatococcus sp.]MCO5079395.1 multidrug effflux MFS transporter [Chelatococcus sp.]CAH1664416.1 Bcr/CflA family efflux transporter [Hyphomicrobiales bacterium]CAH1681809.1 Bcr/CflA family efflux transporter [Hyphomicrobiales bacterium]